MKKYILIIILIFLSLIFSGCNVKNLPVEKSNLIDINRTNHTTSGIKSLLDPTPSIIRLIQLQSK